MLLVCQKYIDHGIKLGVNSTYLYSLHTLEIPKLYKRFRVYLQNEPGNKFDSLLVSFYLPNLRGANMLQALIAQKH